jgi:hypothetical protein
VGDCVHIFSDLEKFIVQVTYDSLLDLAHVISSFGT